MPIVQQFDPGDLANDGLYLRDSPALGGPGDSMPNDHTFPTFTI